MFYLQLLTREQLETQLRYLFNLVRTSEFEKDYTKRNEYLFHALSTATMLGVPCGFRIDLVNPTWPVIFFNLPGAGQVTWHLPEYPQEWDGHSSEEKYHRLHVYISGASFVEYE